MDDLELLKNRFEIFLEEYRNQPKLDAKQTVNLFKSYFNIHEQEINKQLPNYQLTEKRMYIKDGYGIGLMLVSGPGDIIGSRSSRKGDSLYLISEFGRFRKEPYLFFGEPATANMLLFDEGIKKDHDDDLEGLLDLDLSLHNLLNDKNSVSYSCLPHFYIDKPEIILKRYGLMKQEAINKYEWDKQFEDYYGADLGINSILENLYDSIQSMAEDRYFMESAMKILKEEYSYELMHLKDHGMEYDADDEIEMSMR